ncbi:hypothetical protein TSOC_008199, partial [Tetrabaena socialis]
MGNRHFRALLARRVENWESLIEFYHPDFREAIIYFNDWNHLARILTDPDIGRIVEAKRPVARAAMKREKVQAQ